MLYPHSITVPAAGETLRVSVGGCSLIAIRVPETVSEETAPKIYFDGARSKRGPIIQNEVLSGVKDQGWGFFTVEGTTESAGATLTVLISDTKIDQSVPLSPGDMFGTESGATFNHASSDVAQSLTSGEYTNAAGLVAKAMTVTAEGNDIRIATGGASPDQVANPNGLGEVIKAGDFRRIVGADFITTFQFISAVGAAHASVNFTMEF